MEGYIHYDSGSSYSPEHPYPVGDWSSPALAISQGHQDPYSIILYFVSSRTDLFYPKRNYEFRGQYSDYVNRAIRELFLPKEEEVDIDSYVYPVDRSYGVPGITIRRYVYQLREVGKGTYRQVSVLPMMEEYTLGIRRVVIDGVEEDIPIYTGDDGSFLLLSYVPRSVSMEINNRVGSRRSCQLMTIAV